FSGRVERVESTKIFARMTAPGRQVLAYQMKLAAQAEVAMILPIPVPPGSPEDSVRFISLEAYPRLFDDMDKAFPVSGFAPPARLAPQARQLAVHEVGAFVASFVPSLADFVRLDPRFRIPAGTIDRVPIYADWGFAVFQLASTGGTTANVHPMAFDMPTRFDQLFFPTVHVHDGSLPTQAEFSHQLYAQHVVTGPGSTWWPAGPALRTVVDVSRAAGVIDPDATVAKLSLYGSLQNVDTWASVVHTP
ncbi:MAG: hypothetical protein AB7T06_37815, partial [Kofleriaceae bacterium]